MPMPSSEPSHSDPAQKAEQGLLHYAYAWGDSPLPPALTATLVAAQHLRPWQTLPLLFPPIFLFASYLNVQGYQKDAAGLTAAWSAAYVVLARRRKQQFMQRFGARGVIRGGTLALCGLNVVGGGLAYAFGRREDEEG